MIKIAFSPIYKYQLPDGHRFPMVKYELLPEQLLYEGSIEASQFFKPDFLSEEVMLWTHTPAYWNKLRTQTLSEKEERAIGFPMRPKLIERGRYIAHGTLQCGLFALKHGVALNIAGGTHHSFADRGEGFCVLNDIAIAANYLLRKELVKRILIIDLDVHQGNGTASIFQEESRVFTFSMHGAKNYPNRKESSDWDIGLPDHTGDEHYLSTLSEALPQLFERVKPEIVFYLSGADVLATDKLGRLGLSLAGCKRRDELVFGTCLRKEVPVAVAMGGGYSPQISHIIEGHANTFRVAMGIWG